MLRFGSGLKRLLLLILIFTAGLTTGWSGWLPNPITFQPAGVAHSFKPFWESWRLVERYYVDRSAVKQEEMMRGALGGLLDSLGDTDHTRFLSPIEAAQMQQTLAGQMEGIGVRLSIRQKKPVVVAVFPGSPAQKAGIKVGDVLLQADGQDLQNHSLDQIVQLVIGPAGSKVELQLGRPGKTEPEVIQVIRSRLEVPDVTWHMLPGHPVAHLAIESFGEKVHEQLSKALQTVQKKGARALVLDVRANSGGLKDQAIAVTSAFLPDGIVFIEQDAQGHQVAVPVHPKNQATSLPVVVLIDEGTASAAEIFAGALQDHGRAQLVGARTFGTGTVLAQFDLSDGSAIMLAVAQWLTPKKRQIWHKGITPDVEVALPREAAILVPEEEATLNAATLSKIHDKQLLKALEMLKKSGKW